MYDFTRALSCSALAIECLHPSGNYCGVVHVHELVLFTGTHSDASTTRLCWSNNDFYFLIERYEGLHQAFERDILKFIPSNLRHLRLTHPRDVRHRALAKLSSVDYLVELPRKHGLS